MSPKLVDREQKLKEITVAALAVFSQRGYAATSIDQIAAAAGIAKGTVYDYFDSKEDLFVAATMTFVNQVNQSLASRLSAIDDPISRLVLFVKDYLKTLFDPDDKETLLLSYDVLQQCMLEGGVFYNRRYLIKDMLTGVRKIIRDILLDGVSAGIFKLGIARDAEKIATNLLAFLDGAGMHASCTEGYFDAPGQLEYFMRYFIPSILIDPGAFDLNMLTATEVEYNDAV
jgi:AcrR family transcriptional regulator